MNFQLRKNAARAIALALPLAWATSAHALAMYTCSVTATYTVTTALVPNVFGFATFAGNKSVDGNAVGNASYLAGAVVTNVAAGVQSNTVVTGSADVPGPSESDAETFTISKINLGNLNPNGGAVFNCNLALHIVWSLSVSCTLPTEDAGASFLVDANGGSSSLAASLSQVGVGSQSINGVNDFNVPIALPANSVTSSYLVVDPDGFSNSVAATPEPTGMAILGVGVVGMLRLRKKRS